MTRISLILGLLVCLYGTSASYVIPPHIPGSVDDPGVAHSGINHFWLKERNRTVRYQIPTSKGWVDAPQLKTEDDMVNFYAAPYNRPFPPPRHNEWKAAVAFIQGTVKCEKSEGLFCATIYYEQPNAKGNPYLEYIPLHCTPNDTLHHAVMIVMNEDKDYSFMDYKPPVVRIINNCGGRISNLEFRPYLGLNIHPNTTYHSGYTAVIIIGNYVRPVEYLMNKYVELGLPEDNTTTAWLKGHYIEPNSEILKSPIILSVPTVPRFSTRRCRVTNRDPNHMLCSHQYFKQLKFIKRADYFNGTPFELHNITDVFWPKENVWKMGME